MIFFFIQQLYYHYLYHQTWFSSVHKNRNKWNRCNINTTCMLIMYILLSFKKIITFKHFHAHRKWKWRWPMKRLKLLSSQERFSPELKQTSKHPAAESDANWFTRKILLSIVPNGLTFYQIWFHCLQSILRYNTSKHWLTIPVKCWEKLCYQE